MSDESATPPLPRTKRCETCHWCDAKGEYSPFTRMHFQRERKWEGHPGWYHVKRNCRAMAPLHTFKVEAADWCGQWKKQTQEDEAREAPMLAAKRENEAGWAKWQKFYAACEVEEAREKLEAKAAPQKLCKDCRHCLPSDSKVSGKWRFATCAVLHDSPPCDDPTERLTGEAMPAAPRRHTYCQIARAEYSECGPLGKLWQERPATVEEATAPIDNLPPPRQRSWVDRFIYGDRPPPGETR